MSTASWMVLGRHVNESIECRADRAPRVEYIIDEDNSLARDVNGQLCRMHDWLIRERREIVAIKRDVEYPDGWTLALNTPDGGGNAFGDGYATRADTDNERLSTPLFFSTISWEMRVRARRMPQNPSRWSYRSVLA